MGWATHYAAAGVGDHLGWLGSVAGVLINGRLAGAMRGIGGWRWKADAIVGSLDRPSDKDLRRMMYKDFMARWMMKIDPSQLGLETQAVSRL